jgi:hypothetical protein
VPGLVGGRVEQAPVAQSGSWGSRFLLCTSRHGRLGQWRGVAQSARESQTKSCRTDQRGSTDCRDAAVATELVGGRFLNAQRTGPLGQWGRKHGVRPAGPGVESGGAHVKRCANRLRGWEQWTAPGLGWHSMTPTGFVWHAAGQSGAGARQDWGRERVALTTRPHVAVREREGMGCRHMGCVSAQL